MNTLFNQSADDCETSSAITFWHLRDDLHALAWLRLSTVWANTGRSGLPPLNPFRIWGLQGSEVAALLLPLRLLPHVLSLRQPDSPGIREQMALHPQAHLRWALLCLRHHGQLHARSWSVFADDDACLRALSDFLCHQWTQSAGCDLATFHSPQVEGRFNPPSLFDTCTVGQAGLLQVGAPVDPQIGSPVETSPYQGLLDTSLWDILIRMHIANSGDIRGCNASPTGHHDNMSALQGQDVGADVRGAVRREEWAL